MSDKIEAKAEFTVGIGTDVEKCEACGNPKKVSLSFSGAPILTQTEVETIVLKAVKESIEVKTE